MRLLIVDQGGLASGQLSALFLEAGDIVIRNAEFGEAVRMAELFAPHVVLVDLSSLGPASYAARSIAALPRAPHGVLLDKAISLVNIRAAAHMGAHGYWTREASPDELAKAIRQVAAGEVSYCPEAYRQLGSEPGSTHLRPSTQ